ncbi:MAG: cell surface protein SprA [Bacteroidetes bacterium]|nr:cell surface protein SprA [Bacteroidota bacterium]
MKNFIKYFFGIAGIMSVFAAGWGVGKPAGSAYYRSSFEMEPEAVPDSDSLRYPFHDYHADPYSEPHHASPMFMQEPSNVKTNVEYDPDQNQYNINQSIGKLFYRNPSYLSFEEFVDQEFKKSTRNYWLQRSGEDDKVNKKLFAPKIHINSVIFDRIFGGNTIDIRPQGSAELIFAANVANQENPALPEKQRKVTTFDFKENIQMNVIANIGDKLKLQFNYNTAATFDFENKMKLEYTGYEDDIIKKIEAGNVTLPLNSQLIQGSQSLFGIKTQLQFGRMTVTSVFSQQKGKSSTIEVQGGAQTQTFDIKADQYEANKHFFIAQYFKDQYDLALRDLNHINSGVNITRIEVWVTNIGSATQTNRNVVAFTDLGEYHPDPALVSNGFLTPNPSYQAPDNLSNNLFAAIGSANDSLIRSIANVNAVLGPFSAQQFTAQKNYETVTQARLLTQSEYTFNTRLGYISLNVALNPNQVLAVAYEYTLGGQTHHVGELSTGGIITGNNALFVKLLKGLNVNPKFYTWDLMMKNIYSLGGYNIQPKDFRLDVVYQDDQIGTSVNYIPQGPATVKGIPLIKLLNLDQLNTNNDPQPDGMFDIINGVTINMQNGRVIFPVLKPFGSFLRSKFGSDPNDQLLADQYVYDALYDSTKTVAQQQPEKNKFSLRGKYQSSAGSDIPLNAVNIPPGSVTVTAGGATLKENVDYTVDYNLGRVKIINEGYLKSNTPIKINLESNSLFNLQTKTMIGSRFDYYINKDFSVGGTFLHLSEKPLTQKVNIGDEPISNTVWGVDGTYRTDSRFLTKMLDALPFYNTKETSNITVSGEFAQLIPGHSSAIGSTGTSYVDDFEGAVTPLDIKNPGGWNIASVPQGQPDLFPEGALNDSLPLGFNRAKIGWYFMDPLFQHNISSLTPANISSDDQSNNYVREIPQAEIFPNKSQPNGPTTITCMNVAYYPDERGPYNYDVTPTTISAGLDSTGHLKNPKSRWGGIMRKIETSDFESSNIEFIQFWMMDPFATNTPNSGSGGDLYFNLGSVSEDVLRDGQKSFENGLPASTNNYTAGSSHWGMYPLTPAIVNAFDNDVAGRASQDVGLDGLSDAAEQTFFSGYLNAVSAIPGITSSAYNTIEHDPSADDYSYYQSNTYNNNNVKPLERYKKYNGTEGNSPAPPEVDGYNSTATNTPDAEDINKDNNMRTDEAYFQYHVRLNPGRMVVGQNYITDMIESSVQLANGHASTMKWYQFKIPILQPEKVVNGLDNFKNIEFIRMFLKGFDSPVICRFAKLELLRGEWRKYNSSLLQPGEFSPTPEVPGSTTFDITSVSIEENGSREPIPYVLPPGIDKERDISTTQLATLNEQSLSLRVCNLQDGDARAAFKTTQVDIRSYKKLKMFIHAESLEGNDALNYGDLTCFIRLGSDFSDNYYEYEIPLTITAFGSKSPDDVWPAANNMEIVLDNLVKAKLLRNNAMLNNHAINLLTPFSVPDGTRRITIKGSPNLSNVRAMMIGIRNPKSPTGSGQKLCGEVWVNELRLSDFDEQGGWAATARVTAKLADLGTMTLVGNHSTAGWGSIEKKVSERDKVNKTSYDFSTSLELGKFLPEKTGIKIPMFFGYSESFIDPQYNPLDPDVLFQNSLDAAPNTQVRDSIKHTAQDYTQRKSINFTNVKKTKVGGKSKAHVYDVENLNFSYAYTEQFQRNPAVEYSSARTHHAAVGYNFNASPKPVTPFAKSKVLNSPFLRLVKDFNFYTSPTQLSFLASIERTYSETQIRDNSGLGFHLDPTFAKTYKMTRIYGLKYDLTKSVKFDFDARAEAAIDEPPGRIDTREERDSIIKNLKDLGRLKNYHHAAKATYNLPLSKLPLTDWVTMSTSYGGDYTWNAGPLALIDTSRQVYGVNPGVANNISNSQSISVNGNFNLVTLYNKIPFFKKINQESTRSQAESGRQPKQPKNAGVAKNDSIIKVTPSILEPVFKGLAGLVMSVKALSFTYTETNGTSLPGFFGKPDFLGNDFGYHYPNSPPGAPSSTAPGWGFVFGSQRNILDDARRYQWLTNDTTLNTSYTTNLMQNFSARATVEPLKNLKIEITGTRNFTRTHSSYFKSNSTGEFQEYSPTESGNFTMSYLTLNTSFVNDNTDYSNATFTKFSDYRKDFSQILAAKNPNSAGTKDTAGYYAGYGATQQEVLTYAFLAAYSGKKPSSSMVNQFPKTPLPNWRITYDGISKMKWAQKYFQTVTFTHGYRSTYSINSYIQNLDFRSENGSPSVRDTIHNFVPQYSVQQITISEQFAPLLGIEMTWKNSLQTRFEYKRDRTLTLAYSSIQVTEIRGTEYTVGLGYKIKKFTLPFIRTAGGKKKLSSDLNLKADFSLRDNKTIIRKLVEGTNQPSAGTQTISYKFSADYAINERFNIKAFYDKSINNPFVSSSFPTSNVNAGISLRFTLAQ